jgi:hypothetical protein
MGRQKEKHVLGRYIEIAFDPLKELNVLAHGMELGEAVAADEVVKHRVQWADAAAPVGDRSQEATAAATEHKGLHLRIDNV